MCAGVLIALTEAVVVEHSLEVSRLKASTQVRYHIRARQKIRRLGWLSREAPELMGDSRRKIEWVKKFLALWPAFVA